ncbi:MAG: hypothetical protein BWX65_00731 [Bacteroidetes bacterium ADurb.Bin057]|nr:MAG: hypothetical protein BWX65_00731 [Bacteroidetes bacterium ADurb.Bin057]
MMKKVTVSVHEGNGDNHVSRTFLRKTTTIMTAVNKTMFFQKVAQLLSIMASPKQPQSVTGSAIAIQRVSGVIIDIKSSPTNELSRIRMENTKLRPMTNSTEQRMKAAVSASGLSSVRLSAIK